MVQYSLQVTIHAQYIPLQVSAAKCCISSNVMLQKIDIDTQIVSMFVSQHIRKHMHVDKRQQN